MPAHCRLVVKAFWGGTQIRNIFFYRSSAEDPVPAPSTETMQDWIDAVYGPMQAYYDTLFNINTVGFANWSGPSNGIWWEEGPPARAKDAPPWGIDTDVTVSFTGTGVANANVPQAAAVAYIKTARPHVIARKFFGPLITTAYNLGTPSTAFLVCLNQAAGAWKGTTIPIGQGQVLSSEVWGPKYGFNSFVGTYVLSAAVGTQRRRRNMVGS